MLIFYVCWVSWCTTNFVLYLYHKHKHIKPVKIFKQTRQSSIIWIISFPPLGCCCVQTSKLTIFLFLFRCMQTRSILVGGYNVTLTWRHNLLFTNSKLTALPQRYGNVADFSNFKILHFLNIIKITFVRVTICMK